MARRWLILAPVRHPDELAAVPLYRPVTTHAVDLQQLGLGPDCGMVLALALVVGQ